MKDTFYKISNNQNDFIVRFDKHLKKPSTCFIRKICGRRYLGADGFILLAKESSDLFKWKFYNNDGGEASFFRRPLLF